MFFHCVGFVTREQFAEAYKDYFTDNRAEIVFDLYDLDHNGSLDYIEWMDGLEFYAYGARDGNIGLNPFMKVTLL
jgi:hypothetical protein